MVVDRACLACAHERGKEQGGVKKTSIMIDPCRHALARRPPRKTRRFGFLNYYKQIFT